LEILRGETRNATERRRAKGKGGTRSETRRDEVRLDEENARPWSLRARVASSSPSRKPHLELPPLMARVGDPDSSVEQS
jgi:hypothetical protein